MQKLLQRELDSPECLPMPDQDLSTPFVDVEAPGFGQHFVPTAARKLLIGLPLLLSAVVATILVAAFQDDGQLTALETSLIALMALLAGWEAIPNANAIIGLFTTQKPWPPKAAIGLKVAIVLTIRDEDAGDTITGKISLLRSLQNAPRHDFVLHVLSDSTSSPQVAEERRLVDSASSLSAYHHHRPLNVDFKSGNIRNWIRKYGADFDAFILLDADSELHEDTALGLADALAADSESALIQTVPCVLPGNTHWQRLQSVASRYYGELQGFGLAAWMGREANYFGHNAIIRTKAFATCTGLPHIKGRNLWNGPILSHDFVEAALLRRAGWSVRLLPTLTGSFEQAPVDLIAHVKRDARWCLGNFQHSHILGAAGLHSISRFHFISGIFTYLSSAMWLVTLLIWSLLDSTRTGVGGILATAAFAVIAANLLMPRALGILHRLHGKSQKNWIVITSAIVETLFSSLFAPSLMVQRVKIIISIFTRQKMNWAPVETSRRGILDYFIFHWLEVLLGLGLLACIEREYLTPWFLPLAICFVFTPPLSWLVSQQAPVTHEKLNTPTSL